MTPEELQQIRERCERRNDSFDARDEFARHARTDVPALLDEVERLTRELQVERCGVRPIDELLQRVTTDRDELHVAWKREREEVERLTRERDSARDRILEYTDALVERDAEIASLTAALDERDVEAERVREQYDALATERDEARAIANAAVREVSESFLKCKEWLAADAEQARSYGLTHQGIRKMVHDYLDDEMSFGKLVDLIRAAAKAMAEDQLSGRPGGFEP